MYGNENVACQASSGAMLIAKEDPSELSVLDNLDRQIDFCERELERLRRIKSQLTTGVGLGEMKISDLRRAMQY